jgi:thiopeptide-type bacteriocin biosynthesis protein
MVRAPLLPVESYFGLANEKSGLSASADPDVRRAVAVASGSLLEAMDRFARSELNPGQASRMRAKLLRYQIRMSTRPTPFGLFAGVAVAVFGPTTTIQIQSTRGFTRTRPDMAWLMNLVASSEANPAIRKRLSFYANPSAVVAGGRVTLSERAASSGAFPTAGVSIRATGVVKRALSLARAPISYDELLSQLCSTTPSATPERVDKLLSELWEQTFLLTDLRPPLTTWSPAHYVAKRLVTIPEAGEAATRLNELLTASSEWDQLIDEDGAAAFGKLAATAGEPSVDSHQPPVQVDTAMSVQGEVGNIIAAEAARAAELLLRLTPAPNGPSAIASFRQAFVDRYGRDREVPLLELLDPDRGLGPLQNYEHAKIATDPAKTARRSQALLELACAALHGRQQVVALEVRDLSRLETWSPSLDSAPLSLDINVMVGAGSAEAIDKGDFMLVIGPNVGAQAAGRNLARFADLLAPEGPAMLKQIAAAEQALTPDCLCAELVYMPPNPRSANVVIRPSVRPYEITLGSSAGVLASRVIPLDELVVRVERDRLCVRWPAAGKRVAFFTGHMLNPYVAPAIVRFLEELSHDGRAAFSPFSWEQAEGFPFLPRVQAGRIVLRPAQWRLRKEHLATSSQEAYDRSLQSWRTEWNVPKRVGLSFVDNRLVIDLDDTAQAAELRAELLRLPTGGDIILQEVLPALDEAWLRGPAGRYCSEFVVSLVLSRSALASGPGDARAPLRVGAKIESFAPAARCHPPGSEWLFVKIYCPRDLEGDLISDSMFTFCENAVASGFADSWFFLRYADSQPHVRLRFRGSAERLTQRMFPHICEWGTGLMSQGLCLKFLFDTYEREIERFGGLLGMTASEAVFSADSRSCALLMRCLRAKHWPHDETALLALSIDNLLQDFGLTEADRLGWYRRHATPGDVELGKEYRKRKTVLRSLLGSSEELARNQPGELDISFALGERRDALCLAAQSLQHLAAEGVLSQSLDTLLASFVHLHVNRLTGLDSQTEQRTLSLLLRTRESLERAPLDSKPLPPVLRSSRRPLP